MNWWFYGKCNSAVNSFEREQILVDTYDFTSYYWKHKPRWLHSLLNSKNSLTHALSVLCFARFANILQRFRQHKATNNFIAAKIFFPNSKQFNRNIYTIVLKQAPRFSCVWLVAKAFLADFQEQYTIPEISVTINLLILRLATCILQYVYVITAWSSVYLSFNDCECRMQNILFWRKRNRLRRCNKDLCSK